VLFRSPQNPKTPSNEIYIIFEYLKEYEIKFELSYQPKHS
jgi:hypothetical protein